MSRYGCCEACDGTDPHWILERRGDVVVSWACDGHLARVAEGMQRDSEVTELIVCDYRKACEWAAISRALGKIAEER